jgi:hypothetical protein
MEIKMSLEFEKKEIKFSLRELIKNILVGVSVSTVIEAVYILLIFSHAVDLDFFSNVSFDDKKELSWLIGLTSGLGVGFSGLWIAYHHFGKHADH